MKHQTISNMHREAKNSYGNKQYDKKQLWMSLHYELEWFIGLNDQCFGVMFPEDLSRQLLIYAYYLLFVEMIVNKNSVCASFYITAHIYSPRSEFQIFIRNHYYTYPHQQMLI